MRCTNLKMHCETQFVTEHLSTFQVLRHLKPSTCGHHLLVRCSHPSTWHTLLTLKRWNVCCSSYTTIQRHWFSGSFVQVMVTSTYDKCIYKWYKSFAESGFICAKKNSGKWQSDKTVECVCASFLHGLHKSTRHASRELSDVSHRQLKGAT